MRLLANTFNSSGLSLLVAVGILTAERRTEILTKTNP